MTKGFFYAASILPDSFEFPDEYLAISADERELNIEPWRFLSKDMATSLFYYGSMLLKFPGSGLVPFAIIQDESGHYNDGWVVLACFESVGGNPCVRIYDYSKPKISPWDNASYANFSDWLESAKAESLRYKTELDNY